MQKAVLPQVTTNHGTTLKPPPLEQHLILHRCIVPVHAEPLLDSLALRLCMPVVAHPGMATSCQQPLDEGRVWSDEDQAESQYVTAATLRSGGQPLRAACCGAQAGSYGSGVLHAATANNSSLSRLEARTASTLRRRYRCSRLHALSQSPPQAPRLCCQAWAMATSKSSGHLWHHKRSAASLP